MGPFVSSGRGPATRMALVLVAVGVVLVLSGQVAESAPYYEKFGPYYQHDIVSRPNFTDLIVMRGYTKTEGFGSLSVFDDPLTVTPEKSSEVIARVQGFQSIVSLDEANVMITQTLHLPGGTLTFIGTFVIPLDPKTKASRLHCVGGTGEFESVTNGYYELEVSSFNPDKLDTTLLGTAYYHKEESWKKNRYLRI